MGQEFEYPNEILRLMNSRLSSSTLSGWIPDRQGANTTPCIHYGLSRAISGTIAGTVLGGISRSGAIARAKTAT